MDSEEFRRILKEENNELRDNIRTEVQLMIEPIRDTLTAHIKHDEINDKEVNSSLKKLELGQTKLFTYVSIGVFFGAPLLTYALGQIDL